MLSVDDYGRIRRAHRDGMSIREIARQFHHSRYKVREVLRGGGDVARRSREIRGDRQTWAAAEAAGRTLEPLQWLAESSEFGKSHVYSAEVLDAVDAARRAGAEKVETVDLPEAYLKAAGALAQKRAAFAAHRLAAVLREDLSGP